MNNKNKRKPLSEYSNDELIQFIETNCSRDLQELSGICSEILKRMNKIKPLLPKDEE
jgi:hypothetical protein